VNNELRVTADLGDRAAAQALITIICDTLQIRRDDLKFET
jgi:hypothetical protein